MCYIIKLCLDEQRGKRIYEIEDYIFILDDDTCIEKKSNHREFTRTEGVVGSRKSQGTTDFSQHSGTYIVYYSHVTFSNSSFSLVTVRVYVLLFPIGYLAKPTYCVFHGSPFYGRTYLPPFVEFNLVHRSR